MNRSFQGWLLTAACALCAGCSQPPPQDTGDDWVGPQGTWQQVFFDDFTGPAGSAPDAMTWNEEVNGKPDNGEEEYYTNRPQNVALDGNGNLVVTALQEHYAYSAGLVSNQPYTSGRINTQGHLEPTYGRIEARIKLPKGKGMWPAFWLLGNNIGDVGWPRCGEIDILELAGSEPNEIKGSMHGPDYSGTAAFTESYSLDSGTFNDDFHVFALEWTADGVLWKVDENIYHTRTKTGVESYGYTWVFDHPFYVLLNLAVGGNFDGDPDSSTQFPNTMLVDYVKVSTLVPN
ncbi:MAG TPA: glycoside hydrolase family 16 protein [Polyangiaceae bacterium]|jgi:beta-glucanase (GH16 family)